MSLSRSYSQIELYKRDKYLVVTDMTGYRDTSLDKTIEDVLTLCSGNSILWDTPIPAGARIEVRGSKVYWAVRHKGHRLRREIPMPRAFGKPLGKVSMLADYD